MEDRLTTRAPISLRVAARVWLYIGLNSFGGPAGQIATMHRVLVVEQRWIGEQRFLHALNYCMLLPGPEAMQLAVYVGWLLHKTLGGLVAGLLFVLPGACVMLALSIVYAGWHEVHVVDALFYGIKAAVLAIVIEAVLRIGKRALANAVHVVLAAGAFLALFLFHVPFPLVVLSAGLIGWLGGRVRPELFASKAAHGRLPAQAAQGEHAVDVLLDERSIEHARPSLARAARVLVTSLVLWFVPVAAVALLFGGSSAFVHESLFFSKAAVVTFGGAYAVLSYVAQQAVERYHWLAAPQMVDGLGLAETTPGPLILVVQFVGFLGAYNHPGELHPMLAGCIGAALSTWVTFVPCFLWIFLGAPYIEAVRGNRALGSALSAITAAVVGVILNLAVWFALHTLFTRFAERSFGMLQLSLPELATIDWAQLVLACAAMLALLRYKLAMLPVLAACALAGVVWRGL